jgi:paraquat-inducible protein B
MTEQKDGPPSAAAAAAPVIKRKRTLSIVWLVPMVAVLIGAWLVFKAVTEKGPTITISFQSAEGLEAGKTKIKYKDVELGKVTAVDLSEDFSHVTATAEMVPEAKRYLTTKTRFWVVRARVTAGEVTGLGTLLSGAYIGIEPGLGGESRRHFEGLEKQPMVTGETKGRPFKLAASRLGSLNPGSPIYFRQIRVGQVVDYELGPEGQAVAIEIFVEAPYDRFVRQNTRFWLASGLDFNLTANGLQVDTESVVSLLVGGIAFSNFTFEAPGPQAEEGALFQLYETFEEARDDRYTLKRDFIVLFKESVRGLSIGAPVEFRGLKIGEVVDIALEGDFDTLEFTLPVRVRIEPERLPLPIAEDETQMDHEQRMLAKGFRAQLATGNLLTGQLFIDLDFRADAPPAARRRHDGLPVIPSVPSSSQEIMRGVTRFARRLDHLPLEAIGRDLERTLAGMERLVNGPELRQAVQSLGRIMTEVEAATRSLNADTVPRLNRLLAEMQAVLQDLEQWTSADAPLQGNLQKALQEVADAARAVSGLVDVLERHPEALLQGKGEEVP